MLLDMAQRLDASSLEATVSAEGDGVALADRRSVEQILTNLLDNAVKYTEPGGRIAIRIEPAPAQVAPVPMHERMTPCALTCLVVLGFGLDQTRRFLGGRQPL